jgi:hypothetical protein
LIRRATLHCTHTHTIKAKLNLAAWAPHSSERAAATNKKRAGLASSPSQFRRYTGRYTHTHEKKLVKPTATSNLLFLYTYRENGDSLVRLSVQMLALYTFLIPLLSSLFRSVRVCIFAPVNSCE